ncbi:hypothetical protein [Methylobacterium oryzisoli]|uniref:hypothetical protein n=1 Tax=Methylobacterium oryzisoli TaxID=3385502 RepID=UPI0038916981
MEFLVFLVMVAYNGVIILITWKCLQGFDFKTALADKNPEAVVAMAWARRQAATEESTSPGEPSSYSRITGMFGLIVMGAFLWAFGNALIYKMFMAPEDISKITNGVSAFFLSGSALFAPYAFNQIKDTFTDTKQKKEVLQAMASQAAK